MTSMAGKRNAQDINDDTPDTPRQVGAPKMLSVTLRQFAAALGVAMALAAAVALMLPITADYNGMFGDSSVKCGSALVPDAMDYRNEPLEACRDELSGRRVWGWPLGIAGLVVLAGALFVQPTTRGPVATQETGPSESDSEGPVVP